MSTSPDQWKRNIMRPNLQTILLIIAIILAGSALFVALRDTATPSSKTQVDARDGIDDHEAQAILERANDAAAFVGNLLNFLEVLLAVMTIALAGGAWVLRGMILNEVDKAREFVDRTEDQIRERGEHLGQLERALTEELRRIIQQTQQDITQVKKEGRDSFRVMRLQLLAEQQVRSHNLDTALDTLLTAQKLDPNDHATNYLLGYLYTLRKEIDLAIRHLEHALELEPDFTPGIAALGLALRRKGDTLNDPAQVLERSRYWAEAEGKLHEALSKDSKLTDAEGQSYYGSLGGLYRRQQRYYAALDAYERAHQVTPNSSYPIINLATIHKHQGNHKEAAYYFELVAKQAALQLDDDPRDAWTRCDLAQAKMVLGDPHGALRELRTVIDQGPEPGVLETVYDGLRFLAESPGFIDGLDQMISLIETTLKQRQKEPMPDKTA